MQNSWPECVSQFLVDLGLQSCRRHNLDVPMWSQSRLTGWPKMRQMSVESAALSWTHFGPQNCFHHTLDHPMKPPIHRPESPQMPNPWPEFAGHSGADAGPWSYPHQKLHRPKSQRNHLREVRQMRDLWPESALHFEADLGLRSYRHLPPGCPMRWPLHRRWQQRHCWWPWICYNATSPQHKVYSNIFHSFHHIPYRFPWCISRKPKHHTLNTSRWPESAERPWDPQLNCFLHVLHRPTSQQIRLPGWRRRRDRCFASAGRFEANLGLGSCHRHILGGIWFEAARKTENYAIANPFLLLLNVPQILKTGVHLQFRKISDWPIWLLILIDPLLKTI